MKYAQCDLASFHVSFDDLCFWQN